MLFSKAARRKAQKEGRGWGGRGREKEIKDGERKIEDRE